MQGTKVVIWVLAGSMAATALMFGAASLIRAGVGDLDVTVGDVSSGSLSESDLEAEIVSRKYTRLCEYKQWADVHEMLDYVQETVEVLLRNRDLQGPAATAFVAEGTAIAEVMVGRPWSERKPWPAGIHPPTRKELAETTEWCVRELTPEAEQWIAEVR